MMQIHWFHWVIMLEGLLIVVLFTCIFNIRTEYQETIQIYEEMLKDFKREHARFKEMYNNVAEYINPNHRRI